MSTLATPTIAYWNGTQVNLAELCIPVEDRAFFFGDAVYEAIRVYGGQPWLLLEHLERLERSLAQVRIACTLKPIGEAILANVAANAIHDGLVYLQISRGTAPRMHAFPTPAIAPNTLIYSKPLGKDPWAATRAQGIRTILHPDIRWGRRDIKSVNLLANCLAKQAATDAGADECILHEQDGVTEATSNNVFIVKDGCLKTHPADYRILGGITRQHVLRLAARLDLPVQERLFSVDELMQADAVFLTGTTAEILPVAQVDGQHFASAASPVYQALRQAFRPLPQA